MHKKLKYLVLNQNDPNGRFSHVHRSRGDGNCFYRCFAFGLLQFLIEKCDDQKRSLIRSNMKTAFCHLVSDFGYPDFTTMDIWENFEEILDLINDQIANQILPNVILDKILSEFFNNPAYDNYIVSTMRFITSYGLQHKQDEYINFVCFEENFVNMKLYCNHNVEGLGHDADEIQIRAISDIVDVSVKVCYIDPNPAATAVINSQELVKPNFHFFNENQMNQNNNICQINLLYRPGHYDLLIL